MGPPRAVVGQRVAERPRSAPGLPKTDRVLVTLARLARFKACPFGIEHAAAFLVTGILFGTAYVGREWLVSAGAVGFCAAIEAVQLFVPGRHARISDFVVGVSFVAAITVLGVGHNLLEQRAAAQAKSGVQAPAFEVDPFWPRPLPNHWILGSTIGVSVDTQDHVWIIHRGAATLDPKELWGTGNPPASDCCAAFWSPRPSATSAIP